MAIDFEDIKRIASETAETVVDKTSYYAKKAVDKTTELAKTAKIKTEIRAEKEAIKKAYTAIGEQYYALHKNDPEGPMAQSVEEIELSFEKIDLKMQELENLKKSDPDIEVEFTVEDDFKDIEPETEQPAEEAECDCGEHNE